MSQLTPNPASSSQSLSSARKRHFQEVDRNNSQDSYNHHDENVVKDDQSDSLPNPKRSRPSPRTSDVSLQEFGSMSSSGRRRHGQTASSASSRSRIQSRRSSRFIEGSMRDRASDCPPDDFTHDESASDRSMSMLRERASEDIYMSYDTGIEGVRPFGMRRFGKTLAAAFKPASALHKSSSHAKERHGAGVSQGQQRLDDQRVKAEAAYAELKGNNYPGTHYVPMHKTHASTSRLNLEGESTDYQALLKRNSYADRIGDSIASSSNRNRPIAHTLKSEQEADRGLDESPVLVPNSENELRFSCPPPDLQVIPTIEIATPHNQPLSPPALENPVLSLKKVKSYFRLPSARCRSLSPSKPTVISSKEDVISRHGVPLRESPSKRDLKKQKKLMNKISNLEDKLAHAKRNLRLTLQEAPPISEPPAADPASTAISTPTLGTVSAGRPTKFTPGLLPTLPSERMFNPVDRAIHEDQLRKKASAVDAEPRKAQSWKKLTKPPELSGSGSTLVYQLCPSLSGPERGTSANDLKTACSEVDTTMVHAQRVGPGLDHHHGGYACLNAVADSASSADLLADRRNPVFFATKRSKNELMQQERAYSEGIEDRPTTPLPQMSLSPPDPRKHQRSSSKILSEATTESLDQMHNQGLQARRDGWENRVMSLSPQKTPGVPPIPIVPKAMQRGENGKPGGKENRAQETRLSEVREEEDFTWDEDVF